MSKTWYIWWNDFLAAIPAFGLVASLLTGIVLFVIACISIRNELIRFLAAFTGLIAPPVVPFWFMRFTGLERICRDAERKAALYRVQAYVDRLLGAFVIRSDRGLLVVARARLLETRKRLGDPAFADDVQQRIDQALSANGMAEITAEEVRAAPRPAGIGQLSHDLMWRFPANGIWRAFITESSSLGTLGRLAMCGAGLAALVDGVRSPHLTVMDLWAFLAAWLGFWLVFRRYALSWSLLGGILVACMEVMGAFVIGRSAGMMLGSGG